MKHSGAKEGERASMAWPCRPHAGHAAPPPLPLLPQPWPLRHSMPPPLLRHPSPALVEEELDNAQTSTRPRRPGRRSRRACARRGHTLATRRATTSSTPWTPCEHVEHHRDTATLPDTPSTKTRNRRRRRREPWSAADATDTEAMRPNPASPDRAVAAKRIAWQRRTRQHPRRAQPLAGIAASMSTSPQPPRSLARL
jgi:hypothetical protein